MNKAELRNQIRDLRSNLEPGDAAMLSGQITDRLHDLVDWSKFYYVHMYASQSGLNEVNTTGVRELITEEFPTISFTLGSPSKYAPIPTIKFDIIIVPIMAFDTDCNRLGFGGGWYDKFLASQPHALKIGLAYELQKAPRIPVELYDIKLDMVITESAVYQPNKNTPLK